MKKTPMIAMATGIGAAIAGFAWVPDVANTHKDWVNQEPKAELAQVKREFNVLAGDIKHFDIRTDELSKDCKELTEELERHQKALDAAPASAVNFRRHLEESIRDTERQLREKKRMLDQAESNDRDILLKLRRITA